MKRIFLFLTVLAASFSAFAGETNPKDIELTAEEQTFVKQNSDFALRLFRKYRDDKDRAAQSVVLSPLSITYALGMLNNGATGETQQQICTVLGGAGVSSDGGDLQSPAVINSFCRKMIDAANTLDEKTKVLISDNIYVNEARGYHLLPDFVQSAQDYYAATPETRDFFDGETRDVINQWASDHTEGMIKEPLKEEEFDPSAISYLLNALYFKSEWTQPFDTTYTEKTYFDGGNATADMMWQIEKFQYAENDVCQSVQLPYGNGAFMMTVFLPWNGNSLDDLLSEMSGDSWNSMAYEPYQVDLHFPRFDTDTDQRLEEFMASLGMPRAFDPGNAQFDKFAAKEGDDAPFYIDFMKLVAKIRVNESGTEAAAVTIVGMKYGGISDVKFAQFFANRPFLYVISERSTGAIFFMGQYMGEPLKNVRRDISLTAEEKKLVENNNDFAFRLFQQARGEANKVLSPLSVTYALGMINNGAAGLTQRQINRILGGADVGSPDIINSFCRKLLTEAPTLDEETKAEIANTIYVNSGLGYELQQGFVDKANEYYDAQPEARNFYDDETWKVINQWGNDHTHGMIPKIFNTKEDFNQDAASYLLNAIYFKGAWEHKFDKAKTRDEAFNGGDLVPMMSQRAEFDYTENDYYQAIRMPYGNGAYQMTVLLPANMTNLYGLLNRIKDGSWQFKSDDHPMVNVKMPRFKTASEIPLKDILWQLGLRKPFDPSAEFPNFSNGGAYIGSMFQKAVIDLDEEGTEAAAITGIAMPIGIPEEVNFYADRPFLYIISEKSTGAIFFMGQYTGTDEEKKTNELEKTMLVQGKSWHYTYHHFEDKEEPTGDDYPEDFYDETLYDVSYTVKGDTIIDGRDYVKIYRRDPKGSRYYAALREDEEGVVWQYDGGNAFDEDEYIHKGNDVMLCDVTCSAYPGPKDMAMSDVIKIGSQLLHRYFRENFIGVEGVGLEEKGLMHYPFGPVPDCICDYESFAYVSGGNVYFTADDFRAPKYIQLTEDERQLVKNNNDFAFRLFREACNSSTSQLPNSSAPQLPNSPASQSMLLSPLSITYALGMANNGAAGKTQQEICDVLGFGDVDAQNKFCHKMLNELSGTSRADATTKANIANTIFVNRGLGYRLASDFDHWARYYYYATPQNRDFFDGETRDVINKWASDRTEGMIKEVLKEPEFNPMAVSYLLNAIYFKGMWSSPFQTADTKMEPFGGGDPVPMMHQDNVKLEYAENDLCQTVRLPYGNGTYNMQVFLPQKGKALGELVESLNSQLPDLNTELITYDVDMKLPRFATTTDINLKGIMSALGMPTAFNPEEADFSKLCVDSYGENIYIDMMKQVAKIDVNEEGTEAAAVTIIGYETSGMPQKITFHADRPFLYTISEQSTGVILFMGQYVGGSNVVCDVNGDNTVDVADIATIIDVMANGQTQGISTTSADVNSDGVVDVADISMVISTMAASARPSKKQ